MFQKKPLNTIFFIVILLVFCFTYYNKLLFQLPTGVHDWAQGDRYSLAINFYDRGMNFFKPATNNMESIDGVVGVEFPIQAYIAAAIAHLFGRDSISICFRLLDISIACTGLIFLFLTCFSATKDFIFSMVVPLFIFCSPIYADYSGNYLPDPASVSIIFIGFYYLFDFIERINFRSLYICIAIMTLSALMKTSTAAFLIGVMGYSFLLMLRTKEKYPAKRYVQMLLAFALSISALLFYYFYNIYLNTHYNSHLFLASAEPFKGWQEFDKYTNIYFKAFMNEYLLEQQYLFLFALCVPGLILAYNDKPIGRKYVSIAVIFFLASLSLFILMGHQVSVHDYYFISIFFPFIAYTMLVSIISVYRFCQSSVARRSLRTSLVAALTIMFFFADHHMYLRTQPEYHPFNVGSELWLRNGARVMDSLHIPRNEKIFVAYDNTPNTCLVYFDRRGYNYGVDNLDDTTTINTAKDGMRQRGVTILAAKEQIIKYYYDNHSNMMRDFTPLSRSGEIAILRLNKKQ